MFFLSTTAPTASSPSILIPALITLLGVVITALATLASVYLKYWLDVRTSKKVQLDVLDSARKIRRTLAESFDSMHSLRVLLIRVDVSQGYALNDKEAPHYISVVEEIVRAAVPSAAKTFQVYKCDAEYMEKVVKPVLNDSNRIRLRTESLGACFLRNHYEASGVVCSDLLYLHKTTRSLWFLSVNFAEEAEPSPSYLSLLDTVQHKLKSTLEKYPEAGM